MSAQQKFSIFLLAFCFLIFTSPVFAKHPIGQEGGYCDGENNQVFQDNPDGTHSFVRSCNQDQVCEEYETDGEYLARCVEDTNPTPPPTSSPTATSRSPEPPSTTNWDPFKQVAFTGNGLINMASCIGANIPFGTDGCPGVSVGEDGKPETLVFYNGEGGGALGTGTHFIAQMYENPPASGIQYMASAIKGGVNIGKPAYAQVGGSGAGVIEPVQKIWQVFRNVAYLAFVIVFVVAGFMIMLRAKLNPQTVVSIQTALPGLVVGLILVTFSYFISGLIIDLAFVGSHIVGILFLSQIGGDTVPSAIGHVQNLLNTQNAVQMFSNFIFSGHLWGGAWNIGTSLYSTVTPDIGSKISVGILGALAACLNPVSIAAISAGTIFGFGVLGGVTTAAAICGGGAALGTGAGGGIIISGIVYLILLFGLLQAVFRLLFSLIGAYVSIVLNTIFSPFIILWSSVPGNGGVLGLWWKSLLANVLIFPTVFGAFLLVASILGVGGNWHLDANPKVVGEFTQTLPLFGGSGVGFIQVILAYGLLMAIPGIPGLVRNLLHAETNQIIGQATDRGFRGGAGVTGTAIQTSPILVRGLQPAAEAGRRRVVDWFRSRF